MSVSIWHKGSSGRGKPEDPDHAGQLCKICSLVSQTTTSQIVWPLLGVISSATAFSPFDFCWNQESCAAKLSHTVAIIGFNLPPTVVVISCIARFMVSLP